MKRLCLLMAAVMLFAMVPALSVAEEPIVLTAFAQVNNPEWDFDENYALNYIEERTGIHLDVVYAFSNNEAPTQKNLLLASGDYPDIFLTFTSGAFTQSEILNYGLKEEILVPLNDYITEENTPFLYDILYNQRPEYRMLHTASDGNIYGLPNLSECAHCEGWYKFYLNMDWMEALGLEAPTTTDELYEVLLAFKTQDPNGNGIADEIPLTSRADQLFTSYIINSFIPTDVFKGKFIHIDEGKVVFSADKPEFQQAMIYMNKLYNEGLIDPAAFTQSGDQLIQALNDDAHVIGAYTAEGVHVIDMTNAYVYENYRCIAPVEGPGGLRYASVYPFTDMNVRANFVMTDKCKDPAAALRWIDAALQPEATMVRCYGMEGHGWEYATPAAGQTNILGGEYRYDFLENTHENEVFDSGPKLHLMEHRAMWSPIVDDERLYSDPTVFESRIETETNDLLRPYFYETMPDYFYLDSTDEMLEYDELHINITDYVKKAIAQFVTGAKDPQADWDAYVNELGRYGLDRFIELMQLGYDLNK